MEFIQSLRPIIDLLSALLSPIVAVTVVYIAYQQWKINANKADKELQKEKLEIYMAVKRFLEHFDSHLEIDKKLYKEFQEAVALADFLFDAEVIDWLTDVDLEVACWLDITSRLESDSKNASTEWNEKEENYRDQSIDKLQSAHCDILKIFKDKVIAKKSLTTRSKSDRRTAAPA